MNKLEQFFTNDSANINKGRPVKTLFTGGGTSYDILSSHIIGVCGDNVVGIGDIEANTYPTTPQLLITGDGYIDLLGVFQVTTKTLTIFTKIVVDGNEILEIYNYCSKNKGYWAIGSGGIDRVSRSPIYFSNSFEVSINNH